MKKLLLLVIFFVCGAAPFQNRPKYLKPTKMLELHKCFAVRWELNDLSPDDFVFYFYGPQPIEVYVFDIKNNVKNELLILPMPYGKYWSRTNIVEGKLTIIGVFDDEKRYKDKWKDFEIKLIGWYLNKEDKDYRYFSRKVMKMNGVVGFGGDSVTLAKGNPDIKQLKKDIQKLAKKYNFEIKNWEECEGYDFLWKKKK